MAARGVERAIALDHLLLNLANPRHEEFETRDDAIRFLLQDEQVLELARDIADLGGLNPLERLGVFPLSGSGSDAVQYYVTAEGNRRLCALILLNDPDAIPQGVENRPQLVRAFQRVAQTAELDTTVPAIVFETFDDARPWLERLHNGAREGTGRRRWTPEQQARNTSDRTNRGATQLRDLAVDLGIVRPDELSRTTTTQQRFIANSRFRQSLGVVRLPDGTLERVSCWEDFLLKLTRVVDDVANGSINSRSHNSTAQIEAYARQLDDIAGLVRRNVSQGQLNQRPEEHAPPDSDSSDDQGTERSDRETDDQSQDESEESDNEQASTRPRARTSIGRNAALESALIRLGNQKLIDLYSSTADIRLPRNALLAVVGAWSFLECLTRAHGRQDRTEFTAYINSAVQSLGLENTPARNARNLALNWIHQAGNVTKHDWQSAGYDYLQLCNSIDALMPILIALVNDLFGRQSAVVE